jgi:RNA polymerase sigma factor (sigma-70 family)
MTVSPMTDIVRIKQRVRRARRHAGLTGDREPIFSGKRREHRQLAGAPAVEGGTPTPQTGENGYMSARPAHTSAPHPDAGNSGANGSLRPAPGLDPAVDFERYREPASKRFIAMARAMGMHAFHDLDELAEDYYDEFWVEWLERPGKQLDGSPTPYIAGAMMNKLRDLSRRGRSVRAPELLRAESEEILATIAAETLEPDEQVVLLEEMWLVNDIVHSLPPREQVAFAAVFARDSKKKGAPLAGYKLAASRLGVSEARAKKLSLQANKRIREAVEQIKSGKWCDKWARSIELAAAGEEADEEFAYHVDRCLHCRLGVVHLRRQAAILPLPAALAAHAHLLGRIWGHLRNGSSNARHHVAVAAGRHASTAADAGGIVGGSGGAAGAGLTAFKLTAICLGVGLTGAGASVCLQAAGVPVPVLAAITGSHHAHRRPVHHPVPRRALAPVIAQNLSIPPAGTTTSAAGATRSAVSHSHPARRSSSATGGHSAAQRSAAAVQTEFNPGGGSGTAVSSSGSGTSSGSSAPARDAVASSSTPVTVSKPAHHSSSSGATVTSGESNSFSAP